MNNNRFYVYFHRFSNGVLYVGKGSGFRAYKMSKGRRNRYWERLRKKYGNPRVKILASGISEEVALEFEEFVISSLRRKNKKLCNLTDGGDGCKGLYFSLESRKLLSLRNTGEGNPMHGNKHSKEAKKSISEKNKGKHSSGRSVLCRRDIFFLVHEDGREFKGQQWEIREELGMSQPSVSMLCNGKAKSRLGWRLSETDISETGNKDKRHGRYDHTLYHFVHKDGKREVCTKKELCDKYKIKHSSNITSLCNGRLKSHKGWRLSEVKG